MIQDIYPHKLINQYDPDKRPDENAVVMHFRGKECLLRDAEDLVVYPRLKDFPNGDAGELQYLLTVDEDDLYLAKAEEVPVPEGFSYQDSMMMRRKGIGPRHMIFATYTAQQLWRWYKDNTFCGTCGSRTEHSKTERAMVCPNCGRTIYPRILPAVIVAVTNGDKILLTKYNRPGMTFYALVAGFTEIGETLEETVAREVMEEAGLRVKNIRYYKSQPWGIVDDILMGFYCEVDGDDTIRMDENELKEAVWVERADVTGQPSDFSLTNEMMCAFRDHTYEDIIFHRNGK